MGSVRGKWTIDKGKHTHKQTIILLERFIMKKKYIYIFGFPHILPNPVGYFLSKKEEFFSNIFCLFIH